MIVYSENLTNQEASPMLNVIAKTGKFSGICKCSRCSSEYSVRNLYDAKKSPIGDLCTACKTTISTMGKVTQAALNSVFDYDKHTGRLTHKFTTSSGIKGDLATFDHTRGYLSICIGRKQYLAHRVIYMMVEGCWPEHIDHINHDKRDNCWFNLRSIAQADNNRNMPLQRNNSSGATGVVLVNSSGKYRAYLSVGKTSVHLGCFDTFEEAVAARKEGDKVYGYHENHGK